MTGTMSPLKFKREFNSSSTMMLPSFNWRNLLKSPLPLGEKTHTHTHTHTNAKTYKWIILIYYQLNPL